MLEVDEDSRLGRELIAGGTHYHAHFVPDDDTIADLYTRACEHLELLVCGNTKFLTLLAKALSRSTT